jgi:hypothetical protein
MRVVGLVSASTTLVSSAAGCNRLIAFGLLAATQAFGNLVASAIAGALWTLVSPRFAFLYLAAWMLLSLAALVVVRRRDAGNWAYRL